MTKKIILAIAILTASTLYVAAYGDFNDDEVGYYGERTDEMLAVNFAKQANPAKELKIGDKTICPVKGTEFTVNENAPLVTIKDKNFYVCCTYCTDTAKATEQDLISGYGI